jgi:hypothetical protein
MGADHPHLDEAWSLAPEGQEFVVGNSPRSKAPSFLFSKVLARGGVEPWPKLFVNLRSNAGHRAPAEFPGAIRLPMDGRGNRRCRMRCALDPQEPDPRRTKNSTKRKSREKSTWCGLETSTM